MNERKGWNGWWLDGLRLRYHPHSYGKSGTYTLNLERVTDVAALMDLIFQTAGREWADDRALAGLVRAARSTAAPARDLVPPRPDGGRHSRDRPGWSPRRG